MIQAFCSVDVLKVREKSITFVCQPALGLAVRKPGLNMTELL